MKDIISRKKILTLIILIVFAMLLGLIIPENNAVTPRHINGAVVDTALATEPYQIIIQGKVVCLPHTDTSGLQTLDCTYGIKTTEGVYYAIETSKITTSSLETIMFDKPVIIEGVYLPIETLSTNMWQQYLIEGVIQVTDIRQ